MEIEIRPACLIRYAPRIVFEADNPRDDLGPTSPR